MFKIVNIEFCGNEDTGLAPNIIYATLVNEFGGVVISATLNYILAAIRDRNLEVEGITVNKSNPRCSIVYLDKYVT